MLKPVPDSIGLIVGDICNNLHSALDHLLCRLWLDIDPDFDGRVYFPIYDCESRFNSEAPRDIDGLCTTHQALIECSQPYKRGNDLLLMLKELNRIDKHRLIPVVTSVAKVTVLDIKGIDLVVPPGGTVAIPIQSTRPIKDGAELWRMEVGDATIADEVHVNAGFSFDFMFEGIPAITSNKYVSITLRAIRDEVRWVLSHFEHPR